jgi:hypothetical protein
VETTDPVKDSARRIALVPAQGGPLPGLFTRFDVLETVSFSFQGTDLLPPSHTMPMEKNPTQEAGSSYPKTASILALFGGIFMILGGVIFVGAAVFILPHLNYANMTVPQGMDRASLPGLISGVVEVMGTFGLVCGAVVLVSATLLLAKVGQRRTWGILILVFSVLSLVGLGGFIVGAILGILGGVFTLRWKPPAT